MEHSISPAGNSSIFSPVVEQQKNSPLADAGRALTPSPRSLTLVPINSPSDGNVSLSRAGSLESSDDLDDLPPPPPLLTEGSFSDELGEMPPPPAEEEIYGSHAALDHSQSTTTSGQASTLQRENTVFATIDHDATKAGQEAKSSTFRRGTAFRGKPQEVPRPRISIPATASANRLSSPPVPPPRVESLAASASTSIVSAPVKSRQLTIDALQTNYEQLEHQLKFGGKGLFTHTKEAKTFLAVLKNFIHLCKTDPRATQDIKSASLIQYEVSLKEGV